VIVDETLGEFDRVSANFFGRLVAVRIATRVADVDERLVRHQVDERPHDGETAETGVEHADRAFARIHHVFLRLLRGARGEVDGEVHVVVTATRVARCASC